MQTTDTVVLDRQSVNRVLRAAEQLFEQKVDWVVFYRELVSSKNGFISRIFSNPRELAVFETSPEYKRIIKMMTILRNGYEIYNNMPDKKKQRVVTVRMSQELHDALRAEAHKNDVSLNQLCIAKLTDGESVM